MNAGEGVNFQFVDSAFGGLGISAPEEGRAQEDIDPNEAEAAVDTVTLVGRNSEHTRQTEQQSDVEIHGSGSHQNGIPTIEVEGADSDSEVILMEDLQNDIGEHLAAYEENQANRGQDSDEEDDDDDDMDSDEDITAAERQFMFQSAYERGKRRESVEAGVPYSTHSRQYQGHCNVRTVKDCNFFGLQDEYVVSGSDSGHLFIWVSCTLTREHALLKLTFDRTNIPRSLSTSWKETEK